ncbi:MAG: hypothetical protein LBR11_11140 [Deltaproteobacteria bacterium]|jgi:hypothetical protein|nr:hypothetical protein [Deltaproteobacteria bacterium]
MEIEPQYPVMDTQIFNLGLTVEATSAYILICSLVGDGKRPDWPLLRSAWVGQPEALEPSLRELGLYNVISFLADPRGEERFWPNPASLWRLPGGGDQ